MKRTIFETPDKTYRIVEHVDETFMLEDLKGDSFNPQANPDIDPKLLRRDEIKFEKQVEQDGIFGYVLELWNAQPGHGYEQVDSCWGFVGEYDKGSETYNHYIVDEMKQTIESAPSNFKQNDALVEAARNGQALSNEPTMARGGK